MYERKIFNNAVKDYRGSTVNMLKVAHSNHQHAPSFHRRVAECSGGARTAPLSLVWDQETAVVWNENKVQYKNMEHTVTRPRWFEHGTYRNGPS